MRMLIAVFATFSLLLALPTRGESAPIKPNIVFILADDLGWNDVGWHGSVIQTPNLDRLAKGGARLEQFYVLPVCSPTRAALVTGRYPIRYGLQSGVVRPWADYGLPLDERTLARALKTAGYETAICGKWHLGEVTEAYLPTKRGFDHQYGHYLGAIDYFTHKRDGGLDWHRNDQPLREEGYTTDLIANEAIQRIKDKKPNKPLFLYVPFNAVHTPLQVPESYLTPYHNLPRKRQRYAGMTAAMDEAVGRIVQALESANQLEDTLIIFSSDNGGPTTQGASNEPLRAGKGTVYEGGVRVAAFAYWRGKIPENTVVNEPIHIVDWYPTLLKLAGASIEQKKPLDGLDIWGCITEGKSSPHPILLVNAEANRGAIRAGDWKLVLSRRGRKANQPMRVELFHLPDDPSEQNNLAEENPEKVAELRKQYDALAKQAIPDQRTDKPANFKAPKVWGRRE